MVLKLLIEIKIEVSHGLQLTTVIFIGIIVRCIQRLNDLCSDVKNASKLIGIKEMENKMEEAVGLLKRDIVFAASLYTE